jgi:hypothetical protein
MPIFRRTLLGSILSYTPPHVERLLSQAEVAEAQELSIDLVLSSKDILSALGFLDLIPVRISCNQDPQVALCLSDLATLDNMWIASDTSTISVSRYDRCTRHELPNG